MACDLHFSREMYQCWKPFPSVMSPLEEWSDPKEKWELDLEESPRGTG